MLTGSRTALARALIRVAQRLAPEVPAHSQQHAQTQHSPDRHPPDRHALDRHPLDLSGPTAAADARPAQPGPGPAGGTGGGRLGPAQQAVPRPRDEVPSAKRLALADHDVAGWIDREARAVRSIVASGLQLLDLSELQTRYADRWDRVGSAIRRIVESTIDRHLSDRDLWVRGEGETWIILIEGAQAHEAASRTRVIAAEVARRLVGDGVAATDIDADLHAAAAGIQVHSISLELDEPPGRIRSMRALLSSWARSVQAAQDREEKVIAVLDRHVKVTYLPVLNPRLLPGERALCGQRLQVKPVDGARFPADVTGRLQAAIDEEAVRRAIALVGKERGLVFAPIRFDTLALRSHAQPILDLLTGAPPDVRRRLILDLHGILPAVPQPRVLSVLTPVYPLVFSVAVPIDPSDRDLERSMARFVGRSHRLVTLSTAAIAGNPAGIQAALRLLKQRRMRLAVLDVPDEATARRLHRSGACRFLAGDGLWPSRFSPVPVRVCRGAADAPRSRVPDPTRSDRRDDRIRLREGAS